MQLFHIHDEEFEYEPNTSEDSTESYKDTWPDTCALEKVQS